MHVMFAFSLGGLEGGVLKLSNGFDRRLIAPASAAAARRRDEDPSPSRRVAVRDEPQAAGNDLRFVGSSRGCCAPSARHPAHAWMGDLVEGYVAAAIGRVPIIVHGEHGTLQTRNHWIQRTLWGRVDQVLSVSSVLAERMSTVMGFPEERIKTIRNGVETARFTPDLRPRARASFGLDDTDVVVGIVGRLEPVKDQRRFFEAVACLARQGLRFKVLVAGEGTLRQELEAQVASLGVADRVSFLGMRLDVETIMAALDVFVLCSKSEGLSNTILEAMSSGCTGRGHRCRRRA
jgi:glycosyltransferase involved in cell wall biosynthesis